MENHDFPLGNGFRLVFFGTLSSGSQEPAPPEPTPPKAKVRLPWISKEKGYTHAIASNGLLVFHGVLLVFHGGL